MAKDKKVQKPQTTEEKFVLFDMMVKGEMAQVALMQGRNYPFKSHVDLKGMFDFAEEMNYLLEIRFTPANMPPGGVPVSQGHTHDPTVVAVSSASLAKKKAELGKK